MKTMFKKLIDLYYRLKLDGISYARRKGVKIGHDCRIYATSFGSEPWLIEIGDRVTITSGVRILTHDGSTWLMRDEIGRRYKYNRVQIGNDVFIGINSIIMPGVIIENQVIVAAGSVVTKSIPSGVIVGGNPGKIIGDYSEYKRNALESYVSDSDMDYNLDYKSRIKKVIDHNAKKFLEK